MPNRKLIRPNLSEFKGKAAEKAQREGAVPFDQTNAEVFYYTKQMSARTPMVVVLLDGEVIRGVIEWYDRDCVKLNRETGPNLLVPKHSIKYMYKDPAGNARLDAGIE